jgi:alpha-ketoglutarate-dependent taurine dioxygenase
VIWDERATVHRAIGDHFPREREVRRCVVDGDRPYFDA